MPERWGGRGLNQARRMASRKVARNGVFASAGMNRHASSTSYASDLGTRLTNLKGRLKKGKRTLIQPRQGRYAIARHVSAGLGRRRMLAPAGAAFRVQTP